MSRLKIAGTNTGLILSGVTLCALVGTPDIQVPLNPFGINRSPYGEVFAMAMQGPISTNFHVGMYGMTPGANHQHADDHHQHTAKNPTVADKPMIFRLDPERQAAPTEEPTKPARKKPFSPGRLLGSLISSMETGHQMRTNPLPASETLKFYLRRQAEDKLRLAYDLDPSHYANYNSLHFFLIEGITTRPELTPSAAKLAHETIDYCLSKEDDPRPALTAAAACTNILHIMFTDNRLGGSAYSTDEMRAVVRTLDQCIARYHEIAAKWDAANSWSRISPQRAEECFTRIGFITRIRDAAEKTILRIENEGKSVKNDLDIRFESGMIFQSLLV